LAHKRQRLLTDGAVNAYYPRNRLIRTRKNHPVNRAIRGCEMREENERDTTSLSATLEKHSVWAAQVFGSNKSGCHIFRAFRVAKDIDAEILSRSFCQLLARHEALRTCFAHGGNQHHQVVVNSVSGNRFLEQISIATGETLRDSLQYEFARPFDPACAQLIRAVLFADGDVRVLTIVAHRLIVDADAVDIIVDELTRLYQAEAVGIDAGLALSPMQLGDYADWEERFVASDSYRHKVAFFRRVLLGAPAAIDFAVPAKQSAPQSGGIVTFTIPRAVAAPLFSQAASVGVSPFAALLTLYAGTLYRWTDQDVVVIGTSTSVRTEPGLDRAVGMFTTSLPIPTHWAGDPSFLEAFRRVSEIVAECSAQHRCSFDRLVTDLKPELEPGRTPIFQVMFGYHANARGQGRPRWPLLEEIQMPAEASKSELCLDTTIVDGDVVCELQWSAERFTADAAACLAEHLALAAECASRDVASGIGDVPLWPGGPVGSLGVLDPAHLTQPFPPLPPAPFGE
jgi:hypothetical protein